jgi:hypothetical protein
MEERILRAVTRRPRTIGQLQKMLGPASRGPHTATVFCAFARISGLSTAFGDALFALDQQGKLRYFWGARALRVGRR